MKNLYLEIPEKIKIRKSKWLGDMLVMEYGKGYNDGRKDMIIYTKHILTSIIQSKNPISAAKKAKQRLL